MNQSGFIKTLLLIISTVITTIIVIIIALMAYVWIKNPLGLRDIIKTQVFHATVPMDTSYDHPLLTSEQEKQLRGAGIDPAKLPTEITEEQKNCAAEKITPARAAELLQGAKPTAAEILKLSSCL